MRTRRFFAVPSACALALAAACADRPADRPPEESDAAGVAESEIPDPPLPTPQDAFWANLATHCGQAFSGRLTLEPPGDEMLTGTEELIAHFRACDGDVARIAFHIEREATADWDRSRTWVLTRHGDRLELRHDHRRPDGSADAVTGYGGFTEVAGTGNRQEFLSAERSAETGAWLGWRLEIEPADRYTYGTIRDGEWTWQIQFDLSRPVPEPPPAWGHE